MPNPHMPPRKKWSGEQSRISRTYYPKVVKTNDIARSVIIVYYFPCSRKFFFVSIRVSIYFFERVVRTMFWMFLGLQVTAVTKVCASPGNLTWFTRPFLLVRGWGLVTRLTLWNSPISISPTTIIDNIPIDSRMSLYYLWYTLPRRMLLLNMLDKISIIDKHVPSFLCKEATECSGRGLLSPSWCEKSPGCPGRGFLFRSCREKSPGCPGLGYGWSVRRTLSFNRFPILRL